MKTILSPYAHWTATVTPFWLLTALLPVPMVITAALAPDGIFDGDLFGRA